MNEEYINSIKIQSKIKSKTTAWVLAAFLGFFGAHCFYIGKKWLGISILITYISIILIPVSIMIFVCSLFLINKTIDKHNSNIFSDHLSS